MRRIFIIVGVLMVGIVGCGSDDIKDGYSDFMVVNNGEVVTAYVNGVDVTEERKALEEAVKEMVAEELGVVKNELEFRDFCMLENDGITVEVKCDNRWKIFTYLSR